MKYVQLALVVGLCLVMVGCATTQQNVATTEASTEWRLKSLEESFLNFREEQRRQADQNAQNAEAIQQKLAALEAELAALKSGGTVAGGSDGMTPMAESGDSGWVTDLKPEGDGWTEGQKPGTDGTDTAMDTAQSAEEKPWSEVPGASPAVPEPTVVKREKPAPAKTSMAPAKKPMAPAIKKPTAPAKAMYDAGLAKYWAEDFEGARGVFDEFLKKYPKSDLVPNALYWKGETYYSQKNYAQSILTFKEVTGRYPKHAKSAAALLKIGMSYDKVGDPDNAIFYLRALVEDFPKTTPAKMARKELSRLGG